MAKNHIIKFLGFRNWEGRKLMIKFRIEKMPEENLEEVIEEIKKTGGIFWPSTSGWYISAKKYNELKGRLKKERLVKNQWKN